MKTIQAKGVFIYFLTLIIVLITLSPKAKGQSYSFTHYQVENGLSNNAVLCSLQDKYGFMWFGTKDGLNRFDGYTFKVFRNTQGKADTIGSNIIYCLYQDHNGKLWIGTDRGIYQYNALTESFTYFKPGTDNEIRDITEDHKGNLWFIAGTVLYKYSSKAQQLLPLKNTITNAVSLTIGNGSLWVSTANRYIEKYDAKSNSFKAYDLFSHSPNATAYWIQRLYDAGNNQLLVGTSNQGIKLLDCITGTYKDLKIYNDDRTEIFVRDFVKQSANEYWIATESGIYIYNSQTGDITLQHKQYNNPYSLSDNAVYTFYKDREGGIWAGTYFGGLNYYAKQYTYFEKYFPKVGENSISGNAVREICQDPQGKLWIGTEDAGLNRLDPKSGTFTNYKSAGKAADISTNNIHGLLTVGDYLLIGTFEHGLDLMQASTGKVTDHYTVSKDTVLKSNFFYTLYKTASRQIICGTSRGLYYFNLATRHFTPVKHVPSTLFYTSIFEDKDGAIWTGTYHDGVYYFNTKNNTSGFFKYEERSATSISNNKINMIFQDNSGQLWFATENGLNLYNAKSKTFKHFTTAQGLPSNVIYAIREDARKNLWITTSKGLVSLRLQNNSIKVYTKANGLLSDQFNYNSAYRDQSGNIYFGCVKGMIKFNPDNFTVNNYQPPVYITGIQINNKEITIAPDKSPLKRSVSFTDTIKLAYNQSSFSIDFAALSYTSPQITSYAYQLVGLDKDWVYLNTNRKVYFTRLSPGTYTFNVKASDNNSIWSRHQVSLTIIVLPPFWQSNLAYFTYFLIVVIVIYLLVRNYHKRTEQKNKRRIEFLENEKEREIYHAKISFFTHVAHEIRTPLTLIVGPMEKVMQKAALVPEVKKNLVIMERNTQRLLTLTNQLLDFSKTETQGFSLNYVKTDIAALIKESMIRFKDAAQQRKLSLKFESEQPRFFAYVDTEAMSKILSNLLDNAVKYAASKAIIQLLTGEPGNTFTIFVKTDGNLIPGHMREKIFETFFRMKEAQEKSGTGIGLPLARYLAELHKGTLILAHPDNNLNIFALTLPIHQDFEFNI
ncbi:ligand-binding sensor domain-containing protein [Mucilaginibacter sp. KACC 22063]|uniref:ligand-binding sensor domain-containing protein n=1 Tax=Mucilaginibacter sp. KACC 22063 TaxID=3025666 RepID=UPI0023657A31|nr:two-component regulator propeller domain-containing protein [Mucilaginibacter sp. KACC 22063]WDF53985.1 two-component regulator propeller domain-containing protein [Mucilaginibacter sp. KACC 22063]